MKSKYTDEELFDCCKIFDTEVIKTEFGFIINELHDGIRTTDPARYGMFFEGGIDKDSPVYFKDLDEVKKALQGWLEDFTGR